MTTLWQGLRWIFGHPQETPDRHTDIISRIGNLRAQIEAIRQIGGTAGISLGILERGKTVYTDNFGYSNVEDRIVPDIKTVFPGCSLTKAMTAAALGILIEESEDVTWDTRVKEILPGYQPKDDDLREKTTIKDLLSHRTGMALADNYYVSTDNTVLVSKEDTLRFINTQERVAPFRAQFTYNNIGYELAGLIIEALSGTNYEDFVKDRIFRPLGLQRSYFMPETEGIMNVATCYNTLDDGTPTPIASVKLGGDKFGGPSGGIYTCVEDLLKIYNVFMRSYKDQFSRKSSSTPGSPFKQVRHLTSSTGPLGEPSEHESSYAMGWVRANLPGCMGHVGCNPALMPEGMPIVAKGGRSCTVLYHQGSLAGALANVILIPDDEIAIVILSNSLALNDTPDWIGQLILEEILNSTNRNDYIHIAKASASETSGWYGRTFADLDVGDLDSTGDQYTLRRNLHEFVGTYYDPYDLFKVEVTVEYDPRNPKGQGQLYWALQGLDAEKFPLRHHAYDTFEFLQSRNVLAKRGRWVDQGAEFWKIEFHANERDVIDTLTWVHDIGFPPAVYNKRVHDDDQQSFSSQTTLTEKTQVSYTEALAEYSVPALPDLKTGGAKVTRPAGPLERACIIPPVLGSMPL